MLDRMTRHATYRAAQRNLSDEQIAFIFENGSKLYNAGAVFIQLRGKDIPDTIPANHPLRKCAGTTLVMCGGCKSIVTVYRNPDAFYKDKKKKKYNLRKCNCHQPQPNNCDD